MTGKQKTVAVLLGSTVLTMGMLLTLESLRRAHQADLVHRLTVEIEHLRSNQVEVRLERTEKGMSPIIERWQINLF